MSSQMRHYGTIGIDDIFLHPPGSSLPADYMRDETSPSFVSWEMTGNIKERPEDFIVREIGKSDSPIAGLVAGVDDSNAQIDLAAPAPTASEEPAAKKPKTNDDDKQPKNESIAQNLGTNSLSTAEVLPSPETIRLVLDRVVSAYKGVSTDEIVQSLKVLQESALSNIRKLQDKPMKTNDPSESQPFSSNGLVWIPPIPKDFPDVPQNPEKLQGITRGEFHRALRDEFPLLQSESVIRPDADTTNQGQAQGQERWIRVTMDDTFHGLIPSLHKPYEDLPPLYRFHKKGCPACESFSHSNRRGGNRLRGSRENAGDQTNGYSNPILRLRPDLTRDERRPMHHLVSQKNRDFETKTISAHPLELTDSEHATTTTAIVVGWSVNAIRRNRRKLEANSAHPSIAEKTESNQPNRCPYTLCVLKKREMEHLTALQHVCTAIRCKSNDVGLAGIKDMKAVTYQFCTLRNIHPKRIAIANQELSHKGMELRVLQNVDFYLQSGDLKGNRFEIWVRSLRRIKVESTLTTQTEELLVTCSKAHAQAMVERVQTGGFVNFFGFQRVGIPGTSSEVGVRTFDVGRAMLQQNFDKAIDLIMTGRTISYSRTEQVDPDVTNVRTAWSSSGGDPQATLQAFPKKKDILPREKIILKGLKRYGKNEPAMAFKCLPHSVRNFWINAYQSFVWNSMASARLKLFGTKVVVGDLYFETRSSKSNEVKVVDSNVLPHISFKQIVLPLPGYGIQYPQNEVGKLYHQFLENDRINFIKHNQHGTAKGAYRHVCAEAEHFTVEFGDYSDNDENVGSMKITFDLPAGSYATMLLRELMVTTVTRD